MANENNNLPSSIQGDGRKFISLLKNYLGDIQETIDEQYKYITGIFNATADNPDTIAEQVHSLSVDEKRVSGSITLTLKWNSDDVRNYAGVLIEVKEKNTPDPVNWDNIEYTRRYTTAKTNTFTIENCSVGYQYYIRVRARDIVNALSVASAAPVIIHYVSPIDHTPRPPYEFTVVFDKRGAYWSWKQYDQNEYQWTELRLDTYVGEAHNRLDLTTDLYSTAIPTARVGTAYLYNKGVGNAYSAPVKLDFALGVPPAPKNVTVTPLFEGLEISFDAIPENCLGANVYINNESHKTTTNHFTYQCSTGEYEVKIAYIDPLGEGELSTPQTISTVETIPPNAVHITDQTVFDNGVIIAKYIGDQQVVGTKIKDGAISTDKLSANAVTAGKISTNAVTAGTIAAGAVTTETMDVNSINGDRIIANTLDASKIKANTITASQIASNTITADNLLSDNIEMTGNLQVSGGGVTLSERGLSLRQNNGSSTIYNTDGINYYDSSGNIYAQTTKTMIGVAKDGQYVKFKTPWETNPNVIIIPTTFRTNDKNYTSSNTKIICNASEISKNGFRVNNYLQLDEGSTNYSPINKSFTPSALTGVHYFNQVGYGHYTYHISMGLYQDFVVTNIPSTANSLVIGYSVTGPDGNYAGFPIGYNHANSGYVDNSDLCWQVWFNINGSGTIVKMYPTSSGQVSLPVSGGGNLMARLEIYGTISIDEHGPFSTINNFEAQNKIFTNLAKGVTIGGTNKTVPNLVVPWVQYTAATSKIDGGDATFLVTDGGSSLYTVS